jgi:hypothetical protein
MILMTEIDYSLFASNSIKDVHDYIKELREYRESVQLIETMDKVLFQKDA